MTAAELGVGILAAAGLLALVDRIAEDEDRARAALEQIRGVIPRQRLRVIPGGKAEPVGGGAEGERSSA